MMMMKGFTFLVHTKRGGLYKIKTLVAVTAIYKTVDHLARRKAPSYYFIFLLKAAFFLG